MKKHTGLSFFISYLSMEKGNDLISMLKKIDLIYVIGWMVKSDNSLDSGENIWNRLFVQRVCRIGRSG